MDFSFEKTNSAYMLFYERSSATSNSFMGLGGDNLLLPALPGGSSQNRPPQAPSIPETPSFELNKELEDWIWMDNTQFLKDKNIFEHTYFK
jgi:ubiquitin carboxyl-terminal hydrolase 34